MFNGKVHEQKGIHCQTNIIKDKDIIKVISGLRRSGKSTLFELYRETLLKRGVGKKQIQFYNFELPENFVNKSWDEI